MEYLEQLVSEWYEYQGYFVRRDLWVGLEADGSYECELNVVAFHPVKHHLVHVEPYMDCLNWTEREQHFRVKFDAGKKYLHRMFGFEPPVTVEQVALIGLADDLRRRSVAGGKILPLSELLSEILAKFATFSVSAYMVPEQWPLLRTLQFIAEYRRDVSAVLLPESQATRPSSGH